MLAHGNSTAVCVHFAFETHFLLLVKFTRFSKSRCLLSKCRSSGLPGKEVLSSRAEWKRSSHLIDTPPGSPSDNILSRPSLHPVHFKSAVPNKTFKLRVYNGISLSRKKKERMSFAATGMDLEMMILSEVRQTEKDKHHRMSLICRI